MMFTDVAILAAALSFVGVWMVRSTPGRLSLLSGAALILLVGSLWSVSLDRWQAKYSVILGAFFLAISVFAWVRRHKAKSGVPIVTGLVWLASGLAGTFQLLVFPVNALPEPLGPHLVGVRAFELSDANRPGVFGAEANEPRRLLVKVWYPANPSEKCNRAGYFSPLEAKTTAKGLGGLFGRPELLTHLRHVKTNSCLNAELLQGANALPTVFYSHGYVMFAGQHITLMEELASHGYVVYAIQHVGDSSPTVFPNGDVIDSDPELFEIQPNAEADAATDLALSGATYDDRLEGLLRASEASLAQGGRFLDSRAVWVEDRIFVHNQLEIGEVPDEARDIVGASEFSRTGQIGMSYGGSTTGALCLIDKRCAAAVNLDGFDYHLKAINSEMLVPFLMLHADMDMFYASEQRVRPSIGHSFNDFAYESFDAIGLRDDIYRYEIRGAFHLGMSDLPLFLRPPLKGAFVGTTPNRHFVLGQNAMVRGFLDQYLKGLDVDFPETIIEPHTEWILPIDNASIRAWWQAKPTDERERMEARILSITSPEIEFSGAATTTRKMVRLPE